MATLDATKTRLLEAAGEEFAEKGFAGATIRSICKRAEANVAAVNYYFGDKEQLYTQAVIEAHRCGVPAWSESEIEEGPPAEQLRLFIHHFLSGVLAINRESSWQHALMLREMIRPTSASATLVREVIRPKFERLKAIIRRLRPDVDERRSNAIAFSVIGQCLQYRVGRMVGERLIGPDRFEELDLNYLTEHISQFTLAALGHAPPLSGEADAPCRSESRGAS